MNGLKRHVLQSMMAVGLSASMVCTMGNGFVMAANAPAIRLQNTSIIKEFTITQADDGKIRVYGKEKLDTGGWAMASSATVNGEKVSWTQKNGNSNEDFEFTKVMEIPADGIVTLVAVPEEHNSISKKTVTWKKHVELKDGRLVVTDIASDNKPSENVIKIVKAGFVKDKPHMVILEADKKISLTDDEVREKLLYTPASGQGAPKKLLKTDTVKVKNNRITLILTKAPEMTDWAAFTLQGFADEKGDDFVGKKLKVVAFNDVEDDRTETSQGKLAITHPASGTTVNKCVIQGHSDSPSDITVKDFEGRVYAKISVDEQGNFKKEISFDANGYKNLFFYQNGVKIANREFLYKGIAPVISGLKVRKTDTEGKIYLEGLIDKEKNHQNYDIKSFTVNGKAYTEKIEINSAEAGYGMFRINVKLPENKVIKIVAVDSFDQVTTVKKEVVEGAEGRLLLKDTKKEPEGVVKTKFACLPKNTKVGKSFKVSGEAGEKGQVKLLDWQGNVLSTFVIDQAGKFDQIIKFSGKQGTYFNVYFQLLTEEGEVLNSEKFDLTVRTKGPVLTDVEAEKLKGSDQKVVLKGIFNKNDPGFYEKPEVRINGKEITNLSDRTSDGKNGFDFKEKIAVPKDESLIITASDAYGNTTKYKVTVHVTAQGAEATLQNLTDQNTTEEDKKVPSVIPEITCDCEEITNQDSICVQGTVEKPCRVVIWNGFKKIAEIDSNGTFEQMVPLEEGFNNIFAKTVIDGVESERSHSLYIHKDTEGPVVAVDHTILMEGPEDNRLEQTIEVMQARLRIDVEDKAMTKLKYVKVNGEAIDLKEISYHNSAHIHKNFLVKEGEENIFTIEAEDEAGNKTEKTYVVHAPERANNENTKLDDPDDEIVPIGSNILEWVLLWQATTNEMDDATAALKKAEEDPNNIENLKKAQARYEKAKKDRVAWDNFDTMNTPTGRYITRKQLERMDALYFEQPDHDDLYRFSIHIKSFEGLQYAKNVEKLWLSYSKRLGEIHGDKALEPLRSMKKLKSVKLRDSALTNIEPLTASKGIEMLEVSMNRLTDITPVATFKNLKELHLNGNAQLTDLTPVKNLVHLKHLNIENTGVTDIRPIMRLRNLEQLYLPKTEVFGGREDQVLQAIHLQAKLDDGKFTEEDEKIYNKLDKDVQKLIEKPSAEEKVEIPDAGLEKTVRKALNLTDREPITKKKLLKLKVLDAGDMDQGIKNLEGLQYAENLKELRLGENHVSDLSPIRQLQLEILCLVRNEVQDLAPIKDMTSLKVLNIYYNHISDVSDLKNLKNLEFLDMHACDRCDKVEGISALEGLTNLRYLSLESNQLGNDDMRYLKGIVANMVKQYDVHKEDKETGDVYKSYPTALLLRVNNITDFTVAKPYLDKLYIEAYPDVDDAWEVWNYLGTINQSVKEPITLVAKDTEGEYDIALPEIKGFEDVDKHQAESVGMTTTFMTNLADDCEGRVSYDAETGKLHVKANTDKTEKTYETKIAMGYPGTDLCLFQTLVIQQAPAGHAASEACLKDAKAAKLAEIDKTVLKTEGMTQASIRKAVKKLNALKAEAKKQVENAKTVEDVESVKLSLKEAEALLEREEKESEETGYKAKVNKALKEAEKTHVKAVITENATTVLTPEMAEALAGQNVTVELRESDNLSWFINGQDIEKGIVKTPIDMKVIMASGVDRNDQKAKALAGNKKAFTLSIDHEGKLGFTAKLKVHVGKEETGKYGNIFWIRDNGSLKFVEASKIDEEGDAYFTFAHASRYLVVIKDKKMNQKDADKIYDVKAAERKNKEIKKEAIKKRAAKTGDQAPVLPMVTALAGAICGIFASLKKRKN